MTTRFNGPLSRIERRNRIAERKAYKTAKREARREARAERHLGHSSTVDPTLTDASPPMRGTVARTLGQI